MTVIACPHGHAYAGDNIRVDRHGRRHCRQCDTQNERRKRRKEQTERDACARLTPRNQARYPQKFSGPPLAPHKTNDDHVISVLAILQGIADTVAPSETAVIHHLEYERYIAQPMRAGRHPVWEAMWTEATAESASRKAG